MGSIELQVQEQKNLILRVTIKMKAQKAEVKADKDKP